MKDNGLMIICIAIVIFVSTIIAIKYSNLKLAYQKAEADKVEYCEKYYQQIGVINDLKYEMQMQDTVIDFLESDNQLLSSFLAEMETSQLDEIETKQSTFDWALEQQKNR